MHGGVGGLVVVVIRGVQAEKDGRGGYTEELCWGAVGGGPVHSC